MREVPDDERAGHLRLLREQADRDAEALAPRPGYPVYGLAAPSLTPAAVSQYQLSDGEWSAIMLTYGPWGDPQAGPYVAVTTMATDAATITQAGSGPMHSGDLEAELRCVIEDERYRLAGSSARGTEQSQPLAVNRETLPAGEALVCRSETVWAARLLPADSPTESVVVTIVGVGMGVQPESVRLERVPDLRPMIEARFETVRAMIERSRGKPRPPVTESDLELEPAEGVAALRALAEFTLTSNAERRAAFAARQRPPPRTGLGQDVRRALAAGGPRASAAARDRQAGRRRRGDRGHQSRWASCRRRHRGSPPISALRAAALDETAQARDARRHRAERARAGRLGPLLVHPHDPPRPRTGIRRSARRMSARETLADDWLQAWAAWAATA